MRTMTLPKIWNRLSTNFKKKEVALFRPIGLVITSWQVVRLFPEHVRLQFVPILECLQGRFAAAAGCRAAHSGAAWFPVSSERKWCDCSAVAVAVAAECARRSRSDQLAVLRYPDAIVEESVSAEIVNRELFIDVPHLLVGRFDDPWRVDGL